jgi:hypothetical protein
MPTDNSVGASRSETPRNNGRRSILWILSWALGFVLLGVLLVALTNHTVNWSSSDKYCGTACHSPIASFGSAKFTGTHNPSPSI